ncbi:unnamed protein product [Diatraea saccharalis]|uniref:Uncharacterized protein n=1 Tax=Diatraea saccharalis TaxID=40085 RepID=A0A9N9RGV7_9NEOP|nr:unnamed protein product [Diatraea saccharalis]
MSLELAQRLATEAMSSAISTQGDALMTLGQARARMDIETILPTAPIKLLDEVMEWGEAVEGLASAVVDNRVRGDCADVRRTSEFLAHRILRSLRTEMNEEKKRLKQLLESTEETELKDFYVPGEVQKESPSENSP